MEIVFYTNTSDINVLEKSLSLTETLTGNLKDVFDVETPIVTIKKQGMINGNYCYIPAFARYYFVERQEIISNGVIRVYLTIDVLMSFKTAIKNLTAIIDNSTNNNDKYLPSPVWVSTLKTKTDIINFPSGLNTNGTFILITAGGGGGIS